MKTIKIIDLLNKIANGEDVPKKLKYKIHYWEYREERKDYIDNEDDYVFNSSRYDIAEMLNKEAEIIEEDKENKIEKIQKMFSLYFIDSKIDCKSKDEIDHIINELIKKVDEIIDVVNKGENNENN